MTSETIVREVLGSWEQGVEAIKDSWRQHCAPDMFWWNSGRGAIQGLDVCLDAIDQILAAMDTAYVRVPIRTLHADGDTVFVERSDDFYRADGSLVIAVPVTGVISLADRKIHEWRDYCDDWMTKTADPSYTPWRPVRD